MFTSKLIPVDIAGARLNRSTTDEDLLITIVELNIVIEPWPAKLLQELGDDAAAHVFLPDGRIKPELKTVKIRPTRGRLQQFQFSPALDAKESLAVAIEPVLVSFFTFHRKESEKANEVWCKGIIRCELEYRDKSVREFLAKYFGQRVFLSTVGLDGRLNFEAPDEPKESAARPRLVGVDSTTGEMAAPEPDPAAGDVLDDTPREASDDAARTGLHTGRTGPGIRGAGKKTDVH
jgi:hypothetical protein